MMITVNFKHFQPNQQFKKLLQEKNQLLTKYLPKNLDIHWTIEQENSSTTVHGSIEYVDQKKKFFYSEAHSYNPKNSLDLVAIKLKNQVQKYNSKKISKIHKAFNKKYNF